MEKNKYLVVFEKAERNYSAYSPDLPGCIATGTNRKEVEENMREAIGIHLNGMKEDGQIPPEPSAYTEYIEA
jgi:predicted RNase H-like HicB family nuclease